jgi:branched-chain amino acid transport system permease protein
MQSIWIILIVKGFMIGGIYALITLGFNMIYKTTGILNFAQGEFVMVGGMTAAWLQTTAHLPLAVAILGGVLVATITGWLVDRLAIYPARKQSPVIHVIITVAVSIVLRSLAGLVWGTDPMHLSPVQEGGFSLGSAFIEYQNLWLCVAALLCMGIMAFIFKRTRLGRAMRACADNRDAARLCGVSPVKMSATSFAVSAALAGIAGVMITPMISMSFDRGTLLGLKGFSAAILGGLGNPVGGVIGGLALGILEQTAAYYSSLYKEILSLSVVVIMLLLRPKGLFSR